MNERQDAKNAKLRQERKSFSAWRFSLALLASWRSSILFLLLASSFSIAQTSAPSGLDTLSDDKLMTELANRGLTTLLDRAFEINKVPVEKQQGIRSLIALRELSDANVKLTPSQRKDRIA